MDKHPEFAAPAGGFACGGIAPFERPSLIGERSSGLVRWPPPGPASPNPAPAAGLPKAAPLILPFPSERGAAGRRGRKNLRPERASARPACLIVGHHQIVKLLGALTQVEYDIALAIRHEFVIPECLDRRR